MPLSLAFVVLLTLLITGAPVGMAFLIAAFLYALFVGIPALTLASIPYESVNSFALLAIPLFLFMGELMQRGSLANQIFSTCNYVIRRLRYSVGYVVIVTCAFMGAITGSSVATVSAVGRIITAPMLKRGYPIGYVGALTASAGLLGVLIPPSIPLIIYGSTAGVSVTTLFLSAFVPGMLFVLAFALTHRIMAPGVLRAGSAGGNSDLGRGSPEEDSAPIKLSSSVTALALPFIVLGGIYGGVVTPTEAAALGCIYALVAFAFHHRGDIGPYRAALAGGALSSAVILSILAFASVFNRALVLEGIPLFIADFALTLTTDPYIFLMAVTVALFLLGMVMETNTAVLLMAPLFTPVAKRYGIDPLHFGVLMVTVIEVGLLTPPMAANVFVATKATGASIPALIRHLWPFLLVAALMVLLILFIPLLTTWPNQFK
jgi:C4-dicarboxylate transporter, DctM subunit